MSGRPDRCQADINADINDLRQRSAAKAVPRRLQRLANQRPGGPPTPLTCPVGQALTGPVLSAGNWPISVQPSWQSSIMGRLASAGNSRSVLSIEVRLVGLYAKASTPTLYTQPLGDSCAIPLKPT